MTNSQKAFEEWYGQYVRHRYLLEKNEKGEYALVQVRSALATWQACWDARGKFDEEICKGARLEVRNMDDSLDKGDECDWCIDQIRKRGGE